MKELKEPAGSNPVTEILIDRDCPMCRQFGRKRASEGFTVTPREAARGGSIEVKLADGSSRAGYFAMLEIFKQRKTLPEWLYAILRHPICAFPGKIGYRLIAMNRKFISRLIAPNSANE